MALVAADQFYMGHDGVECEGESPVLVTVDQETGMVFAHIVPRKGPEPSVVSMLFRDLETLGSRRALFKTDQEPVTVALQREVLARVPGLWQYRTMLGINLTTNELILHRQGVVDPPHPRDREVGRRRAPPST